MNEADQGNQSADLFLEVAIENAKRVTGNERLTGFCLNRCGEPTAGAYCSKECRQDAVSRERMRRP